MASDTTSTMPADNLDIIAHKLSRPFEDPKIGGVTTSQRSTTSTTSIYNHNAIPRLIAGGDWIELLFFRD